MMDFLQRNSRFIAAAALILLGVWIVHDFLAALAWAVVIAIASWPLYQRFVQKLPVPYRRRWGSMLFTSLVAVALLIPLTYAVIQAGHEASLVLKVLHRAQQFGLPAPQWLGKLPFAGDWLVSWWSGNLSDPHALAGLLLQANSGVSLEWAKIFGRQIVHRVAILGLTLITLYFLYRDGTVLGQQLVEMVRRAVGESGQRYIANMARAVRATVNGLVMVGLAEGVLLWIGYALAGLEHAALLGALTALLAMIPFAALLIFGGASIALLVQGNILAAAFLFCFGALVLFVFDHFVRPALISGGARLPFLWVLLGILGGLENLGLLGLFVGPALMAALISLWRDRTAALAAQ